MIRRRTILGLLATASIAGPAGLALADDPQITYLNTTYSKTRDPFADLVRAKSLARAQGKQILIEVGGEWCIWCKILDKWLADHPRARAEFARSFIVMKVHFSMDQPNTRFLSQYPNPQGYPHFYVLDANGTLMVSQDTGSLEQGQGYDEAAMIAFARSLRPD